MEMVEIGPGSSDMKGSLPQTCRASPISNPLLIMAT